MLEGKDGQALFHRILPATDRGLTSTTVGGWHLNANNKKCNNGLIKSILGYHELNDHTHF